MKQVLITGASGFIGNALTRRLLRNGVQVRALLRPDSPIPEWSGKADIASGDICDASTLAGIAEGVDTVFHLAGVAHKLSTSQDDKRECLDSIVEGTRNILDCAVAAHCRTFVYFSSTKVMGEDTLNCRDETTASTPDTPYGFAKLEAEQLVMRRCREADIRSICLRPCLVYGPEVKGNLRKMIGAIDRGFFPPISDTNNRRSMVHVNNLIEAALLAGDHPSATDRCYIVADAKPYSTREIYELMIRALGRNTPKINIPPGTIRLLGKLGDLISAASRKRFYFDSASASRLLDSSWYSSKRISLELGYRPRLTFEDAVAEMVSSYRNPN